MSKQGRRSQQEKFDMTQDEINRFSEALKKEEFRKLLCEYAEEISNPANREQYEREIAQLEQERGNNVTFIQPEPGFCLKTMDTAKRRKYFINICQNDKVEPPTCAREGATPGGLTWHLPHTCSPAREDTAKQGSAELCTVQDVVFHTSAYRMAESNERFRQMLEQTAMDTIEANFGVKLDREQAHVLKNLKFKGRAQACVIRKPVGEEKKKEEKNGTKKSEEDLIEPIVDQIKRDALERQKQEQREKLERNTKRFNKEKEEKSAAASDKKEEQQPETPKFTIVHRGHVDMQDYALTSSTATTRPRELSVEIELPLVASLASADVKLDVFERHLTLAAQAYAQLDVALPYPVREKEAAAKFDKAKRRLTVTVPVVPEQQQRLWQRTDSTASDDPGFISSSEDATLTPPITPPQPPRPVEEVKRSLLSRIACHETSEGRLVCLVVTCPGYVKDSVRVDVDGGDVAMTCESCSSGGYIQYHAAVARFTKWRVRHLNEAVAFVDQERFKVVLAKEEPLQTGGEEVAVFLTKDGAEELRVCVEKEAARVDEVNAMSRKEYILNFDKIVAKGGDEDDDDDDDVDDDVDHGYDDKEEDQPKFAKAASQQAEQVRFNKKRRNRRKKKSSAASSSVVEDEMAAPKEEKEESAATTALDNVTDDDYECEEEYLQKSAEHDDDEEEEEKELKHSMSSSTESTEQLSSSLNEAASTFNKLKGILKKPRSFSESDGTAAADEQRSKLARTLRTAFSSEVAESSEETENYETSGELNRQSSSSSGSSGSQKKSVSFNKQIIRNVFKPGSTVCGMKKSKKSKNSKKNALKKRKRTTSEEAGSSGNEVGDEFRRSRSVSESSGDDSGGGGGDNNHRHLSSHDVDEEEEDGEEQQQREQEELDNATSEESAAAAATTSTASSSKKKNRRKKNKAKATTAETDTAAKPETLLQWQDKKQQQPTKSNLKFNTGKIIRELED